MTPKRFQPLAVSGDKIHFKEATIARNICGLLYLHQYVMTTISAQMSYFLNFYFQNQQFSASKHLKYSFHESFGQSSAHKRISFPFVPVLSLQFGGRLHLKLANYE